MPVDNADATKSTGTIGLCKNGTEGNVDRYTPEYRITQQAASVASPCSTASTTRETVVSTKPPTSSAAIEHTQNLSLIHI